MMNPIVRGKIVTMHENKEDVAVPTNIRWYEKMETYIFSLMG